MRRFHRLQWLMPCLICPALVAGCQLGASRQAAPQLPATTPAASNTPAPSQPVQGTLVAPAYGGTTTAALATASATQPADPMPKGAVPPVTQVSRPPNIVDSRSAAAVPAVKQLPPVVAQTQPPEAELPSAKSLYPRGEPGSQRKSYTDITAHSSFGHAPDYTWISGEATKWRSDWRLRYSSVDEVDAHGGCLILCGDEVDKLKDGEHFKLLGHIEIHGAKNGGDAFYVEAVEPAK